MTDARKTGWARALWQVLEPIHAAVYFAPEVLDRYKTAGLKGFWMGYFASRAYPLGAASPELVAAVFFNFHRDMVARALPDAWRLAPIGSIAAARYGGVDAALRRMLGSSLDDAAVAEAADMAAEAASLCSLEGRPLFAAYAALPWPEPPHLRLWHAATLLREHRGDGHVIANVAAGVDGVEAHVLMAATTSVPRHTLQPNRGWSDDDWEGALERLRGRGWFSGGGITAAGRRARHDVEDATDRLANRPWDLLGASKTKRLRDLVLPLAQRVVDQGGIPVPNPMGVPWPPGAPQSRTPDSP